MNNQSSQTIKNLLKKFTDSNLLLLEEASEKMKVSKDYLIGLIKVGKIKAFKVDKDWFIEENWLDDFKKNIKEGLEKELQEIKPSQVREKFFKQVSYKKAKKKVFNFFLFVNGFFKLLIVSLSSLLIFFIACFLFFSLIYIDNNKLIIAHNFNNGVNRIYSKPLEIVMMTDNFFIFNDQFLEVNDENLTRIISAYFVNLKDNLNRDGQVAGESEGFNK